MRGSAGLLRLADGYPATIGASLVVLGVAAHVLRIREFRDAVAQMLGFQAQTTSWAKDTPMGPMFQSQRAVGEELIELVAGAARALWRIEKDKSES